MIARLRVGLVCPYSFDAPGGVQNHVLGLARYLLAQGHQPYVLAPGALSPAAAEIIPADRFVSAGRAVPVSYNGSTARVNFGPLAARRVRRWLDSLDLDVVHLHEPITPSIAILGLAAAEVPVVATFHTATPRSRTMHLAGVVMRALIERIDAGIAVSESARDVVVRHLGRDALVVPNGIRLTDFPPRRPGGAGPRVVFLGRLDEPRKGLDVLLAAVPTIRAALPGVDIVVAGGGQRGLPAGVRAVGAVSDAERAELLASADVFVAPHRARESFGIVLLEAMASGAAVVASDIPAFHDVLRAGTSRSLGRVFPAGDVDALAGAVVRAVRSPNVAQIAAARSAAAAYDWSQVGPRILEVYTAAQASWSRQHGATGPRTAATWAALDAALIQRARRAAIWAGAADVDARTARELDRAATTALQPGLSRAERERAESDLSLVLRRSGSADHTDLGADRVRLARRLHNDAVSAVRTGRPAAGRTPGRHAEAQPFEMADHRT